MDSALLRIPLLNKIYSATKQVNDAFSSTNKTAFRTVVLVEFPHAGVYSIGFITSDQQGEVQAKTGQKVVCVFVPATPNPTSGFLLMVPEDKVIKLDMSVPDAIKYVISLGAILPGIPPLPARTQRLAQRGTLARGSLHPMIETAAGLVLRTRPLTETSLIVHWLTPDLGRVATVAKGAHRPKSPFRGKMDLFYLADFSFSRSRRSELHTLREVSLRETHSGLRKDLGRLQQAAYCTALVEQATETETPLPHVFALMTGPGTPGGATAEAATIFSFELKLLTEQGLKPDLDKSKLNPGTQQLVKTLLGSDWQVVACLRPTGAQAAELSQFLHGFVLYHLGRIPRGRDAALGLPS